MIKDEQKIIKIEWLVLRPGNVYTLDSMKN